MNDGIIIPLAYPETIVRVADEWYSSYLHYFGIGKKNYVKAGHAAFILVHKTTGMISYYDFGRYITPQSYGRVRSKITDHELDFPIVPIIENGSIKNLNDILIFLATNPKFTHGNGKLIASVCDTIDYQKAENYISKMQNKGLIRYAAFKKQATNCSRFVTDTLIAGVTDVSIKKKLKKLLRFTPSTIGNVVAATTQKRVFEISEHGEIRTLKISVKAANRTYFLDKVPNHQPNLIGSFEPMYNDVISEKAQWLSGIGCGAWFEIHNLNDEQNYRFRRISPFGDIDTDSVYEISEKGFDITAKYEFIHYSNCHFFHIKQQDVIYRFDFLNKYEVFINLKQKEYLI